MKSKKQPKKVKQPIIPEQVGTLKLISNFIKKLSNIAIFFAGSFATLAGVTLNEYFTPKVEFEQTNSLSESKPFLSLFELRNLSHLPIKNVKVHSILDSVVMSNNSTVLHATVSNIYHRYNSIGDNQTATLDYNLIFSPESGYTTYARIAFVIKYKFCGFSRTHLAFYQCIVDDKKRVIWSKDIERDYIKNYPIYTQD